jgi:hypothetical protein
MWHKYKAASVEIDGHVFPSQLEGNTYSLLKRICRSNTTGIKIKLQHLFELRSQSGSIVCKYLPDFLLSFQDSQIAIESKGVMTDLAALKIRFFKAEYPGIPIFVVKKDDLKKLLAIATEVELANIQDPEAIKQIILHVFGKKKRRKKRV